VFEPLYRAVAWLLVQLHAGLSLVLPKDSGWAWAGSIILLTVLMRVVLFPLFVKQIHSSRKMAALQPQMQALRKKYKNDKQRMNQELMKLYQENGANPVAGCLPLVVQMPIFWGLFGVLRGLSDAHPGTGSHGISPSLVHSAQNANIFGAHIGETFLKSWSASHRAWNAVIVTGLAVIISSTTTFLSVRSSMKRQPQMEEGNPMAQAQKLMVFMAPLFGLFGLNFPLGVLIYWVTTNSWTLAQQNYIFKRYPMPDPRAAQDANQPTGTGPAKKGAAAKGAAGTKGAAGASSAKAGGSSAKASQNGSDKPNTLAARRARLKKAAEKQQDDVQDDVPQQPKVVRKQPVRQSRSKRSGSSPKR
jgi:YidC/Oxa1 family membrane protein insertase